MRGRDTHLPGAIEELLNHSFGWAMNPRLLIFFLLARITSLKVRRYSHDAAQGTHSPIAGYSLRARTSSNKESRE